MDNLKHTPAPWTYYTEPQPNGCPIIGSRGLMVATLAHTVNQDDQRETALANARLIAAAPDLLAALQRILPFVDCIAAITREDINEYEQAYKDAIAAIDKATGETK